MKSANTNYDLKKWGLSEEERALREAYEEIQGTHQEIQKKKKRKMRFHNFLKLSAVMGVALGCTYVAYLYLDKQNQETIAEYKRIHENDVSMMNQMQSEIDGLEVFIDDVVMSIQEKVTTIADERPAFALAVNEILSKYRQGGIDRSYDVNELRFLSQALPGNINEADYRELLFVSGIDKYDFASPFIENHLADNGRTVVTSEDGLRIQITYNPYHIDSVLHPSGKYSFPGVAGLWTKEEMESGIERFIRQTYHPAGDFTNDLDVNVYARHNGVVVYYKDADLEDPSDLSSPDDALDGNIKDYYNYSLGRTLVYKFWYQGTEYRVQLSHLDRSNGLPELKPGDRVTPGMIIGQIGSTGFSTGAHLDVRYYQKVNGNWEQMEIFSKTTFLQGENILYVDYVRNFWQSARQLSREISYLESYSDGINPGESGEEGKSNLLTLVDYLLIDPNDERSFSIHGPNRSS